MGKRKKHTEEFKREAVKLLETRGERTIADVASNLVVAESQLHAWRKQYGNAAAEIRKARGGETPEEEGQAPSTGVGSDQAGARSYQDAHAAIWREHFNGAVAENEMKWVSLQPTEGSYNFSQAKAMVNAARNNDMLVRGHVLVWFDQTPEWVFAGSKEQVLTRMRTHITRVMQEFAGSVYAWDVVNEAVVPFDVNNQDVGEDLAALDHWGYRDSQWYQKTGEDFIFEAFAAARAADCRRHTWGAARVWFVSACFLSACFVCACFVCACFLSACFVTACTSGSIDPLGPSTALALLPSPSSHVVDPFWLWPPTTSGGQTSDTSPDRPRHPLAPTNKRPRVKRESQEECERRLYRECPDCMGPACL